MAHWFHRNPFKATAPQKFDVSKICMKNDFLKVIYTLRDSRIELLKLFTDVGANPDKIDAACENYFTLIQGLFEIPNVSDKPSHPEVHVEDNEKEKEKKKDDKSKTEKQDEPVVPASQRLNTFFYFKWTQSLHVDKPSINEANAKFDFLNMAVNVGLWYSKYAARLAAQPEVKMEDAKTIHTCLRKAAGIFKEIKDNHLSILSNPTAKTSDLDPCILEAYIYSSQAEAQEVTIARAVEKKHTAKLIAGLANETAKLFLQADDSLKTREAGIVGKWRKYLQLKAAFYNSYATCYFGSSLLECEKCGESVRVLEESLKYLQTASKLCSEYKDAKGAGSTIKPNEHSFYINFCKNLNRTLEKSKSENGFIYHQKVPPVVPNIQFQATHGLVDPLEYSIGSKSEKWTDSVYTGFSVSKNVASKKKSTPDKSSSIVPVKEPDIKVTKDGCVIS